MSKQKIIPAKMIAPPEMLRQIQSERPGTTKCELYIGRQDVSWPAPEGCCVCRKPFSGPQTIIATFSEPIIRIVIALAPSITNPTAEWDLCPNWAHVNCLPSTDSNLIVPFPQIPRNDRDRMNFKPQ